MSSKQFLSGLMITVITIGNSALAQSASDQDLEYYIDQEADRSVLDPSGELHVSATTENLESLEANLETIDCNCEKLQSLSKAVASSHKGLFYDNNFDYLCDPCYDCYRLGDSFKRIPWGDNFVVDFGGQYRFRYHNEHNHRGTTLNGQDDSFSLHRTRLFANAEIGHRFRAYAELIDANSDGEDFNPRPIEENRTDMLNLFGDVMLYEDGCCNQLWARAGRQELLYGSQRVVSPLDWANTRRTFEGYKLMWEGTNWDIDAFWVRPVPVTPDRFDGPDQSQEFMGVYGSYKACENTVFDLYYLRFLETDGATNFNFDTVGARLESSWCSWKYVLEGDVQFGDFGADDHFAGAFTVGLGRDILPCHCWKPSLWVYYDWASGDETQGNGYHHLFPLAHKYLGFMDLFGRRNIEDLNVLLTANPCDNFKILAWYHMFNLQDGDDVPYTVVMGPSATTPGGDQELGQEIDLVGVWTINERMNLLLGYSRFFAGDFYSTNGSGGLTDDDADFYYTQFTVNF